VSPSTLLSNLLAHWVQVAVVIAAGAALARLTRLRSPAALLGWWRLLLLVSILLPALQPWPRPPLHVAGGQTFVAEAVGGSLAVVPWARAVLFVIAAGTAFRLFRLGLGLARLRAWRRSARPADACLDAGAIAAAVRDAGASAQLLLTREVDAPATYGARRPVVLLPERMSSLPPAGQRDILLHELRHVRRGDWSRAAVEELIAALFWFHPALAWLRGRIRLARELVVDAEVVARTGERRRYLETLLAFAEADGVPPPAPALFSPPHLASRVDALMKEDSMTKARTWSALAASAAVVALAGATVVTAVPLRSRGGDDTAKAAPRTAKERKVVQKTPPTYPLDAKKAGIEGSVVLDVLITAAGEVTDVKAVKGPEELREAAAAAVRQWKYEPGPVDTRATLTIRYALDKEKKD
jgi:bla regulator protein BlaR1